jgi:hypothetical protein
MNHNPWIDILYGIIPYRKAQKVANTMGLTVIASGPIMTGTVYGHDVTITVQPLPSRHGLHKVNYECNVAVPPDIKLVITEPNFLLQLLRWHPRVEEQTGRNLVEARFKIKTSPPFLQEALLSSLDFCYGLLLLPSSRIMVSNQQLIYQPRNYITDLQVLPSNMEMTCRLASTFEQIVAVLSDQHHQ